MTWTWHDTIADRPVLGVVAATVAGSLGWIETVDWRSTANTVMAVASTVGLGGFSIYMIIRGRLDARQRAADLVARQDRHDWEVKVRDEQDAYQKRVRADRDAYEAANRDSLTEQLNRAEAERKGLTARVDELLASVQEGRAGNHAARELANTRALDLQLTIAGMRDETAALARDLAASRARAAELNAEVARLNLAAAAAAMTPRPDADLAAALIDNTASQDRNTASTDANSKLRREATP